MDYEAAKFWLELIIVLVNLSLWLYVWRSNKDKATKRQLDEHAVMLAKLDERLKSAVGHPELRPIYDKMNDMADSLSEMRGKMHTLDLIHDYMINKGGGK